jgi:hypothetical protein
VRAPRQRAQGRACSQRELGKPGDFDHIADDEPIEFINAQGEIVRKLERQLLTHQPRSSARHYQASEIAAKKNNELVVLPDPFSGAHRDAAVSAISFLSSCLT